MTSMEICAVPATCDHVSHNLNSLLKEAYIGDYIAEYDTAY